MEHAMKDFQTSYDYDGLTQQQCDALNNLIDFAETWNLGDQGEHLPPEGDARFFRFLGYAGSGKTYLLPHRAYAYLSGHSFLRGCDCHCFDGLACDKLSSVSFEEREG
jgi:hypothetical protein